MRRPALLAAAALLSAAAPASAQEPSAKAHLDDFAVPATETGIVMQQLGSKNEEPLPGPAPPADREVTVPGPPRAGARGIVQVSTDRGAGPARQVDDTVSREVAPGGISSPRDSRPGSVTRLVGEDRCDPGQDTELSAECQQILELRAAEFQAAEPPKLSPEQVLLAERGESIELIATTESNLRLKLAGGSDPSAESRSNQELASIYLDDRPPVREAAAIADGDPSAEGAMAELIESLGQALPADALP